MIRSALFVPLDEVRRHLETNERQDVKIVVPSILTEKKHEEIAERQRRRGTLGVKQEVRLPGERWTHSPEPEPNRICESAEFMFPFAEDVKGPFAVAFANEGASQGEHLHKKHAEMYYSERRLSGYYFEPGEERRQDFDLPEGGLAIFQPHVVHYVELGGLTFVLKTPSLEYDRGKRGEE